MFLFFSESISWGFYFKEVCYTQINDKGMFFVCHLYRYITDIISRLRESWYWWWHMEKFRNPGIHHILLSMQSFFSVQYVVIYNTFREWCSKRYANQYSFLDHIGLGGGGKSWAKNQTVLFKLFFLFLIINFLITVGNQFFFYNVCIVFQSLGSLLLRFFWKDI